MEAECLERRGAKQPAAVGENPEGKVPNAVPVYGPNPGCNPAAGVGGPSPELLALRDEQARLVPHGASAPYTLETIRFSNPSAMSSAMLLSAQITNGCETLRAVLTGMMGVTVDATEGDALALLRRELAVTAERMREFNRSVAINFQKKQP